jgi:hypothetical protein
LQHQSRSSSTHRQSEHETRESSEYMLAASYRGAPVGTTSDSFATNSPAPAGAPATPSRFARDAAPESPE